jgi:hypothetical protein
MPGAGGATSAAWLYRIAPQDGTAILGVSPNAILGKLFDEGVRSTTPRNSIISPVPSAACACA